MFDTSESKVQQTDSLINKVLFHKLMNNLRSGLDPCSSSYVNHPLKVAITKPVSLI